MPLVDLKREEIEALNEAARFAVQAPAFATSTAIKPAVMGAEQLRAALDRDGEGPENSGQDWMQTSLATVLLHFESEARSADELARDTPIEDPLHTRYRTESDTYEYVLKHIRSSFASPRETQ